MPKHPDENELAKKIVKEATSSDEPAASESKGKEDQAADATEDESG